MKLIPVMDLLAGQVVHARRGERDNYRPIQSTLCPSAAPLAILQALIERFACDTIYIADLDAIRFQQPQYALIERMRTQFPVVDFWLDAGIGNAQNFYAFAKRNLATPVIGSESLRETDWLNTLDKNAWILSLDFKQREFLGLASLLEDDALWPQRILAMNLAQVGSELGPDFSLLENLRRPDCLIYAAGGVRDNADLLELQRCGFAGALVATALHNGKIVPPNTHSSGQELSA